MDLEPLFRARPALHRFPGAMSARVRDRSARRLVIRRRRRARVDRGDVVRGAEGDLQALPGFGEMKVKALDTMLAKRFGVEQPTRPSANARLNRRTERRPQSRTVARG
jgi:hypothetical protein